MAKGAALALRLITQAQSIDIDFDRRIHRRLPFAVTFWDHQRGGYWELFREHEMYDELTEKWLPVPDLGRRAEDRQHKEVFLGRRWPGDDSPMPYLRFQFGEVISGPLAVWYDTETQRFCMRDEGGSGEVVSGEEIQRAIYIAPVQSGKY